jgi:hypothetical protein
MQVRVERPTRTQCIRRREGLDKLDQGILSIRNRRETFLKKKHQSPLNNAPFLQVKKDKKKKEEIRSTSPTSSGNVCKGILTGIALPA